MVVSSSPAKFSPNSDFHYLAGGAMPQGGISLDGNLHLPSRESTGHSPVLEKVFEEVYTW